MSSTYRASVNIQAPHSITRQALRMDWARNAVTTMAAKIDQHMILHTQFTTWAPTSAVGIFTVRFVYDAGQDTEAVAIIHDAAKVAGASYDAVRVTHRGRRLDGPALLAAAR